jgi:hypothetical protein
MQPSGVFLKKTPPVTPAKIAGKFWNRSKTLRRQRGSAGSIPAGRSIALKGSNAVFVFRWCGRNGNAPPP